MPTPSVAVITAAHPARARNGLLGQAMRSVYGQTRQPEAIHVAMDTDREGAPATRQRALMSAKTDVVAFLDSDDMFMPHHLEVTMRHMEETGADFVYSWFKVRLESPYGFEVLEHDPVFPPGHFLNPFDPENPIETTITTVVRTELAQEVGFQALNRGEMNTGEDRYFTLKCLEAGAKVSHLVEHTWYWRHWGGNTSGMPTKGDARDG